MANPQHCIYYKYGHCKFQNLCRNNHLQELCDIEHCDGRTCDKRHPKLCRYFQNYGKCKFSPCSYHHGDSLENVKIQKLENVVHDLKREMDELRQTLKLNADKIRDMEMKLCQYANNVKQPTEGASKIGLTSTQCQKASVYLSAANTATRGTSIVNAHGTLPPPVIPSSSLVPFWTTRGNSCCYHECRPDDKPPGKCCYHRCRELWD